MIGGRKVFEARAKVLNRHLSQIESQI